MLFCCFPIFTMEFLLLYIEFLHEFVELNGNARNLYFIYGFRPSFLEKLFLCHSILSVSCSSSQGCMCKPYQQFSIFKCRNIVYIGAPRLVTLDKFCRQQVESYKDIFFPPLFLASSLVIPFSWVSRSCTCMQVLLYAVL